MHNVEGPAARLQVTGQYEQRRRTIAAGLRAQRSTSRPASARCEHFAIKPERASGRSRYAVRVTGPNDIAVKRHLTFDVKPPAGDIKRTTVTSLKANGGKLTLSRDLVPGPDPVAHAQVNLIGRPDRAPRRAGAARRARPLSLRLRRADGQPRPAARLRQRRGRRKSASRPTRRCKERVQRRHRRACSRCRTAPAPSASGVRPTPTCG